MSPLICGVKCDVREHIAVMAKENQRIGAEMTNRGLSMLTKAVNTREELAKSAGVSNGTMAKIEKIATAATPEMKAELRNGNISINQAYQHVKRRKTIAR